MLNGKELQVGKSYKTRDGSTVIITHFSENDVYPYKSEDATYTTEGFVWKDHEDNHMDIISEMHELNDDTVEFNVVTKPKHYQLIPEKNIEVKHIVAILADRLGTNGYNGAFIADFAQMLQYLMRFDEKNGKEDLEKAKEFLGGMLEKYPDVQTLKGQK